MPDRSRKSLVIDASIAGASGGKDAIHPTPIHCRDFLLKVLETEHCLVMSPEISREWDDHQSRFARAWRVEMVARRRLHRVQPGTNFDLRRRIDAAALTDRGREAMFKDCHLIEAALAADSVITALDDAVRALFAQAAATVRELRGIAWVNPDRQEEQALWWLEQGAPLEQARCLHNYTG